ncbi:GlsB/YeaQ/YmgE family stress response membrane protein [Actinoplanes sp. NPDC051859]|uniref:GlsB/YeaQ/YmgE family stress response membrane protein n=1 Tax=Actinoplanes sp. NPDC051859 TaxID=3363909 RepID=UPI003787EE30
MRGHPLHTGHLTEGHVMSFLWAIIAGLIIGLIARAILPGRQNIPIWLTILLGVLGALIGNAVATALGVRDTGGIDWIRHIVQIAAAAGLIAVVTPLWAKRTRR